MSRLVRAIALGVIVAAVTFIVLLGSGLGTTCTTSATGQPQCFTTIAIGLTIFPYLVIGVVFLSSAIAAYALISKD